MHWNGSQYSREGCETSNVTETSVVCSCSVFGSFVVAAIEKEAPATTTTAPETTAVDDSTEPVDDSTEATTPAP
eukprot:3641078-Rhodomonas_salina.1